MSTTMRAQVLRSPDRQGDLSVAAP